jgi:hypothetical protein
MLIIPFAVFIEIVLVFVLFDDVKMQAGKAWFQTKYTEQEQFIAEQGKPVPELSK